VSERPVVPGEVLVGSEPVTTAPGAPRTPLHVVNTGDRPVQVGSHFHFAQANPALLFDRTAAHGQRLDVAAGTAVRFEPGIARDVDLVPLGGGRVVPGLTVPAPGRLDGLATGAAEPEPGPLAGASAPRATAHDRPGAGEDLPEAAPGGFGRGNEGGGD
jgi:urease subunit beta